MPILLDLTPLRASPAYRRLFTGFALAGVGSQLTVVAIGLQVYELTGSSFSVGLVGLFALVPIIIMGLYGGALLDAHDRRTVAIVASWVMWVSGILTALQAWLGNTNPLVLYLLVAVNSAGFAVVSPARVRTTILQAATPDYLRGRLQGVFIVVVAGGPAWATSWLGPSRRHTARPLRPSPAASPASLPSPALSAWQRGFLRYDGREPTP